MASNPYAEFDNDDSAEPIPAPKPIETDRGEPTTRAPKRRRKGVIVLVVGLVAFALLAVGFFLLFFINSMKSKTAESEAMPADPALEHRASSTADLKNYQDKVAAALEEQERRKTAAAAATAAQPSAATTGVQPSRGSYDGSAEGAARSSNRKKELTPEEQAELRRWQGEAVWGGAGATTGVDVASAGAAGSTGREARSATPKTLEERMALLRETMGSGSGNSAGLSAGSGGEGASAIGDLLATENYAAGTVSVRPDRSLLLIHGTTIPCTLIPRIVTNYPGGTSCLINRDVYSADGSTLLIRKGSVASGERKVDVEQGVAKVFVAWRDIEQNDGVSIRLDSMAADQLGGAGLDAWIDNHYAQRFGGAILLSFLDDVFQAVADQAGDDEITFDNSTDNAQDMASIALENSINIPPTGYVQHATETNILVARDIYFGGVYEVVQ